MNPTVFQIVINYITNNTLGVPVYITALSVASWLTKDNPLNLTKLGDDISTIDPYYIDGYRYNPSDEKWYEVSPAPDYGQFAWELPADAKTQDMLTWYRDLSLAWRSGSYDEFFKKYPVPEMKPPIIGDNGYECYIKAQTYTPPRRDPLALDLDGDGIETTAQDGWNGVLFDHNNDSIKTATGWLSGDDGFLVLDKNGNGLIDNGNELFGDNTQLGNGAVAADGFAALADLDSNQDGVMDANDAVFANLRVWQDLNQDGLSQANELKTLDELGITSLSTTGTASGQTQNGNIISLSSSYSNSDGTATQTANLLLSSSTFHTEFTDHIATSATDLARPDVHGSGQVRNFAGYDAVCFYRIN